MEQKTKEKEKEKVCPLNPELRCEDCKFYQPYPGGRGKKACLFMQLIGDRL